MSSEKLRLELPVLLPDVPDEHDACVHRLTEGLSGRDGVDEAHVVGSSDGDPARLCIHYDPERLTLREVRRLAESAGAGLTDRYGHAVWMTRGLRHVRHARTVSARLGRLDGVLEANADPGGAVRVEFDRERTDRSTVRSALGAMGVTVVDRKSESRRRKDHDHAHEGLFGERAELVFAMASGVFLVAAWLSARFADVPDWVPFAGYLAGYFFGGFFTVREAVDSLRIGRFEIDFLMLVAAAGAAFLGAWAEGALLLFLFSLGHALEHYAMGRARRAIESLSDLAPDTALVRRDDTERTIAVDELEVGDLVIVRSNERLPADGFVVRGSGAVDQSPVTGESVPVDKTAVEDPESAAADPNALAARHRVFAGTINGSGSLEVRVTRRSDESTLARVVQLVTEAETERSPTQHFTDRFERVFVPAVLGLVVLLLFAWLVVDEPFAASFYRAMAVLVAASPCALAIATPSAVLSGVARAGRGGVLVKGGGPLENLGTLTEMAFDKTGTLTEGRPKVTNLVAHGHASEDELLATAAAIERHSDHPLAAAVVAFARERLDGATIESADDFESITGQGVRATLGGEAVLVGKEDLFDGSLPPAVRSSVERLEEDGRTAIVVRRGDRVLGVIGLMDTPRGAAAETVSRLRSLGIRHMVMLSGDNQRVVGAVARQVGIEEAHGDLLPDEKVETVRRMGRSAKVAMVGDGVNDAPAMANATVGIAMGAAGSDVALETADVALMADDLGHLPFAVGLSRRTSRIIRQNLWISLGMVALLVPATIFGLGIGPAVALHEGSTLVVVFNALRLLAYRE